MNELTQEWLKVYRDLKANGENPSDSIFFRLALHVLPIGVDPDEPEVKQAIAEIAEGLKPFGESRR